MIVDGSCGVLYSFLVVVIVNGSCGGIGGQK